MEPLKWENENSSAGKDKNNSRTFRGIQLFPFWYSRFTVDVIMKCQSSCGYTKLLAMTNTSWRKVNLYISYTNFVDIGMIKEQFSNKFFAE